MSQPTEIVTLAASLKCDPDLIFEYVYNNIEYEPLFGSNKGALGTLLDLRGDDIDQAQLFVALLNAAGFSSTQMNYWYGYIRLNGAQASGWLGVKNDGNAIAAVLANGGNPIENVILNPDGTLKTLDVSHVWVQVTINGSNYMFDPSFKQHTVLTGLSGLATVMGFTEEQFLADAGGTIDDVSISNLNRTNIRSDLVSYAGNLVHYIKTTNPGWSATDVVGGKSIQYLTGSPLRQSTEPNLSPYQPSDYPENWGSAVDNLHRTCFTISMPGKTPQPCSTATSDNIMLYSDQTYGHRITVFSTGSGCAPPMGSCIPTLLIDGAPPPNGDNTGTAIDYGHTWTVTVEITHPYGNDQCGATSVNQCDGLTIHAGGSYLIAAGWGQVGRGMVEKHRMLLAQARAALNAENSELVLGETLAVISYNWLAESADQQRIGDALASMTTQYHHGVGIAAQTAIQGQSGIQGPYVDLPMNFFTLQSQTTYSGSTIPPTLLATFFSNSGAQSSLIGRS